MAFQGNYNRLTRLNQLSNEQWQITPAEGFNTEQFAERGIGIKGNGVNIRSVAEKQSRYSFLEFRLRDQ